MSIEILVLSIEINRNPRFKSQEKRPFKKESNKLQELN